MFNNSIACGLSNPFFTQDIGSSMYPMMGMGIPLPPCGPYLPNMGVDMYDFELSGGTCGYMTPMMPMAAMTPAMMQPISAQMRPMMPPADTFQNSENLNDKKTSKSQKTLKIIGAVLGGVLLLKFGKKGYHGIKKLLSKFKKAPKTTPTP